MKDCNLDINLNRIVIVLVAIALLLLANDVGKQDSRIQKIENEMNIYEQNIIEI